MNKIVLAQINTIAGDINANTKKIIECIQQAKTHNADIIVFPKYALCGFPYGDIFKRHKSLLKKQENALNEIKEVCDKITAIVGYYTNNEQSSTVAIIQNKKINNSTHLELNNEKYEILTEVKTKFDNIDTIIHCDCCYSRLGIEAENNELFSSIAKKNSLNYIYVNSAGYADNLCFNGTSKIYDKNGNLTLRAKSFEEDIVLAENYKGKISEQPYGMDEKVVFDTFKLNYESDLDRTYKSIVYAIKEYFNKNGFKKAVLGLSGGLDSTVCAVLLTDALGKENVWGVSMPSKITSNESKNDAKILAENLGINFFEIPLAESIDQMKSTLNYAFENVNTDKYEKSTTIENLQARTRATILWSISNEFKQMLPIATSDKSEAYIGYATVNGDMSGGFAPIIDVTKTKLFALADFLNKNRKEKNAIPQSILEKPPGAELKINPKTGKTVCAEEENMPYEFLDEIIWFVENKGFGFDDLMNHKFYYETKNSISIEQKEEWINKFYWKSKCAVYKWHIIPPSVITDRNSINSAVFKQPIISKVY